MKMLLMISLLISLSAHAASEVCTDGKSTLILNFDSMTFELDGTQGTLERHGMNWAGQIHRLIFENGDRMELFPTHFDNSRNLVIDRDNMSPFLCDKGKK